MRNTQVRGRYSRGQQQGFPVNIVYLVLGVIVTIFIVIKVFGGSSSPAPTGSSLSIFIPDTSTNAYLVKDNGGKVALKGSGSLYTDNTSLFIESGYATAKLGATTFDISENTEISYSDSRGDGSTKNDTIHLLRGLLWSDSASDSTIVKLSNFSAKVPSGGIALFEQNAIFSSVYAIRGDIQIITKIGQYTLKPGKKLALSSGEAENVNTILSDKVHDFDSSVAKMDIFIRNDGETILKASVQEKEDNSHLTISGSITKESTASGAIDNTEKTGKYISFTQPMDGSTIKTATTPISGTILSSDVSRITFNDVDAVVSPVNETFTMDNFALEKGINNIVYKVYSFNGIELERGVLVVHGSADSQKVNTIIPENFPNLKDFIITSPASNPYATTESYVRVQGQVPTKTVKYITVNGYRLQKFVPNSSTWYYHANASIGTIKEGTNLYHIKFYDANDREIHTQIFTIIKDSTNATTNKPDNGEIAPLFPTT